MKKVIDEFIEKNKTSPPSPRAQRFLSKFIACSLFRDVPLKVPVTLMAAEYCTDSNFSMK